MNSSNNDDIIKLLFLLSCFGAGNPRIHKLKEYFGSLEGLYRAIAFTKPEGIFTEQELKSASRTHGDQLRGIISYCKRHNIGIICFDDEAYPERLRNIYNPPILLFYKGDKEILRSDIILAVVGARKISEYSAKVADKITGEIVRSNIVIASGFAVGTDITAHLAAVRNGGKTIAVLGSGIDHIYPQQNAQYFDEILENGVFISEYFPQTSAKPSSFIARNRILAGISMGAAVIEASERSGSLNTASYIISQGSDLWVIPPHDIFDPRYNGGRGLLRDGALPLFSASDIIQEYFENYTHKPVKERKSDYISLNPDDIPIENKSSAKNKSEKNSKHKDEVQISKTVKIQAPKSAEGKSPKSVEVQASEPFEARIPTSFEAQISKPVVIQFPKFATGRFEKPPLEGVAKLIYQSIANSHTPITIDDVIEDVDLDVTDVLSILTDLEIGGYIFSDEGQTYYV
ncbi:MAG: DNA-processing protein DprA [Oscillospiraceae bacterium]|nr:DNA-processing protein DprA [Oscillospiraceae bacterium]